MNVSKVGRRTKLYKKNFSRFFDNSLWRKQTFQPYFLYFSKSANRLVFTNTKCKNDGFNNNNNNNPLLYTTLFPSFFSRSSNWHEQFHIKFSLTNLTTTIPKTCMIVQCLLYININIEYRHLFVPPNNKFQISVNESRKLFLFYFIKEIFEASSYTRHCNLT